MATTTRAPGPTERLPSISASGIDTATIIDQLMPIERQPQTRLKTQVTVSAARKTALSDIQTRLKNLQLAAQDLKSADAVDRQADGRHQRPHEGGGQPHGPGRHGQLLAHRDRPRPRRAEVVHVHAVRPRTRRSPTRTATRPRSPRTPTSTPPPPRSTPTRPLRCTPPQSRTRPRATSTSCSRPDRRDPGLSRASETAAMLSRTATRAVCEHRRLYRRQPASPRRARPT